MTSATIQPIAPASEPSEPSPVPLLNMHDPSNWEKIEGVGTPLTISQLIARLHSIRLAHGDLPCYLRNYLESNVLAPITDLERRKFGLVLCSHDLPASEIADDRARLARAVHSPA